MRIARNAILILFAFSIYCCQPEKILLHGNIAGIITDAETTQPIEAVAVLLNQSNVTVDTTSTDIGGFYQIRGLIPGEYKVQASMYAYSTVTKNTQVAATKTNVVDIALTAISIPFISVEYLDFGTDSIILSFAISNLGRGTFTYLISKSQDWISINPSSGEITDETDLITVALDKTGLTDDFYEETIEIVSSGNQVLQKDSIAVYINGVVDRDGNGYRIVKIGTQIWMGENLNVGEFITHEFHSYDNSWVEKYCYGDIEENCDIYGGLYRWDEMTGYKDYNPRDSSIHIGTTQGICPDGWHIPTKYEWEILIDYLGGPMVAGGALKATGNLQDRTGLWESPNEEATNQSGFSALPGSHKMFDEYLWDIWEDDIGTCAYFWTSTAHPPTLDEDNVMQYPYHYFYLENGNTKIEEHGMFWGGYISSGNSVRCIKDP